MPDETCVPILPLSARADDLNPDVSGHLSLDGPSLRIGDHNHNLSVKSLTGSFTLTRETKTRNSPTVARGVFSEQSKRLLRPPN